MDEQSQQQLDRITALEPEALTESDKAFLRARRTYLTPEQKKTYKKVIDAKPAKVEAPVDRTPSLRTLKQRASRAGMAHKGESKESIEVAVRTAEGAEYDAQENKPE